VLCFGSADSKGVTGVFCVSADYKGVKAMMWGEAWGDPSADLRASSRPFDSAPFEALFGAHGKQGKQGRQFRVGRGRNKEAAERRAHS